MLFKGRSGSMNSRSSVVDTLKLSYSSGLRAQHIPAATSATCWGISSSNPFLDVSGRLFLCRNSLIATASYLRRWNAVLASTGTIAKIKIKSKKEKERGKCCGGGEKTTMSDVWQTLRIQKVKEHVTFQYNQYRITTIKLRLLYMIPDCWVLCFSWY